MASVTLPERLDSSAAFALKSEIEQAVKNAGGGQVALDASGVTYLGGLCLQVLLASRCPLVAPSEPVVEAYGLFGVSAYMTEPLASLKE